MLLIKSTLIFSLNYCATPPYKRNKFTHKKEKEMLRLTIRTFLKVKR